MKNDIINKKESFGMITGFESIKDSFFIIKSKNSIKELLSEMKKLDIMIIISFLVLSLLFTGIYYLSYNKSYDKKYVEVYVNGALYKEIPLTDAVSEEMNITTKYGENLVLINSGQVKIADADCPDKVCIKSKAISKPGENIVCLPHKLIVEIKGVRNVETDDLSY